MVNKLDRLKDNYDRIVADAQNYLATHRGTLPDELRQRLVKARILFDEALREEANADKAKSQP